MAANTLKSWQVSSMLRSLNEGLATLDEMWAAMRREHAVQPLGVPTQVGALRAYLQHVRGHLRAGKGRRC